MTYKYLIPVGDNCEISGHLTRNGYTFSSIFRYAACSLSQVCKCFEDDFKDIFSYDHIIPINKTMVKCQRYNISWHTKFEIHRENGEFAFKNKSQDQYNNEISKLHHLINNVRKALNDRENKILFIYKSNHSHFADLDRFIEIIESKHNNPNFELLVVKSKDQTLSTNNPKIIIRDVEYLAPYSNSILGGDDKSWNTILSAYIKTPKYEEILFKTFQFKGHETADHLRDIALKFETINDLDTAYALMKQAGYCKPTDSEIAKKIGEYREKIDQRKIGGELN